MTRSLTPRHRVPSFEMKSLLPKSSKSMLARIIAESTATVRIRWMMVQPLALDFRRLLERAYG